MNKPYIIAEIGSNFDQSINKAKKLIDVAKSCSADAVKFQLFSGKILYPNDRKMQKIFKKVELNPNWIDALNKHANKKKIKLFFSAFDKENLKMLITKKILFHKIASSETVNFELFKFLNKKKFTVFLSSGMSDLDDVKKAVKKLYKSKLIIMQCTSLYPTLEKDVNLNVLNTFKKNFKNAELGLSDHTLNDVSALTAVGMGVKYFEKHITLNKRSKGPDHFYAYEPKEFKRYVKNIHLAYSALGSNIKEIHPEVKKVARLKGLYAKNNIKKGLIIKKKDIDIKPPALGLRDKEIKTILNKKAKFNILKGKPLKINFFK